MVDDNTDDGMYEVYVCVCVCVVQKPRSDSNQRLNDKQRQQQKVEQQQQQQQQQQLRQVVDDLRPSAAAKHPATHAAAAAAAADAIGATGGVEGVERRLNDADVNDRQEGQVPTAGYAELADGGDDGGVKEKKKNTEELAQSELVKRDALPRVIDKASLSTLPPLRALQQPDSRRL